MTSAAETRHEQTECSPANDAVGRAAVEAAVRAIRDPAWRNNFAGPSNKPAEGREHDGILRDSKAVALLTALDRIPAVSLRWGAEAKESGSED
jgi:hypothetical protein